MSALEAGVTGQARDHLTRVVAKLLTSGAALDLKRWVRGVDLTADRVGFLLSHDLETATQIIKASDESTSSAATEERFRELVLVSVSSQYFQLRRQVGIAVDSERLWASPHGASKQDGVKIGRSEVFLRALRAQK